MCPVGYGMNQGQGQGSNVNISSYHYILRDISLTEKLHAIKLNPH